MDTKSNLIFIKGQEKTKDIYSCDYNSVSNKYHIQFVNGSRSYSYSSYNVMQFENPKVIIPSTVRITRGTTELNHIKYISIFDNRYCHIIYENGQENTYNVSQLKFEFSCLLNTDSKNVFNYLKTIAKEISLKTEDDKNILEKQYVNMEQYLGEYCSAAKYLHPSPVKNIVDTNVVVFPFGANSSQIHAVKNALENDLSVIEGPPGTGKTQTILNIIANLIIRGKTVEVVSNNNSATDNVLEKLCKYDYGFLVAKLGRKCNREKFIENQTGILPNLDKWQLSESDNANISNRIKEVSETLNLIFDNQALLAKFKQELSEITTEKKYFDDCYISLSLSDIKTKSHIISNRLLKLWLRLDYKNKGEKLSSLNKIMFLYLFGIGSRNLLNFDIPTIKYIVKEKYYILRIKELKQQINDLENQLEKVDSKELIEEYIGLSNKFFRNYLFSKYGKAENRRIFSFDDLWKKSEQYAFTNEYPVVLSTTYSSRSSLPNYYYDYIIMDEASQVDVATGTLALSVAKNAVVVGDRKQLPNVVTELDKKKTNKIFSLFSIKEEYNFSEYSFLSSICKLFPNMPKTLLREHYRCHPKIIEFCNKKFYNNELIIMTQDNGEEDVLKAYKTVKGNHARGHISQRQIDEITQNILPELQKTGYKDIGIIAPYRDQVEKIQSDVNDDTIKIETVHKFQGRENDAIIMSTVDDEITSFSDDSNLLNVAVSRAVNSFKIIVNPNEKNEHTNIGDLVSYIEYNNFEVINSEISSVFDYLYSQYQYEKQKLLTSSKRVSEFDSENLMYQLIETVLTENGYSSYGIITHLPLKEIFKNLEKLNAEEIQFVAETDSHVDFMIYNKVNKKPLLAVEVDGYDFHKAGTMQYERDIVKDKIFERYDLPLIRFKTNSSGEKEKLAAKLKEIVSVY